jgi:hypothetical protein
MRARLVFFQFGLAILMAGMACKSSVKPSDAQVTEFIAGMSSFDTSVQASQQSGQPPAASGGPSSTVTGNGTVVNGGSSSFGVNSSQPFQKIIVSVNTPGDGSLTAASTGFPQVTAGVTQGFFELTLPNSVESQLIIISFGTNIPTETFTLQVQCVAPNGDVGAIANVDATVLNEDTTGAVQVTATWDAASDVDLHLVEPGGNEIFWGAPTSNTGGALNVDSNPACFIDNINNENISYPDNTAPNGTYIVRLDYFASCNVAQTNFVVSVNNGGQRSVFTGNFTGSGDSGAAGSGRFITQFTRNVNVLAPGSLRQPILRRPAPEPSPVKLRIVRERRGGR